MFICFVIKYLSYLYFFDSLNTDVKIILIRVKGKTMQEKIFGIALIPYFIIGIVYAFVSYNRRYSDQSKNGSEQEDKLIIWFLSCVFWPIFAIVDIIDRNTNYANKEDYYKNAFIIKESKLPIVLINAMLRNNGMPLAETVLEIPDTYTNPMNLEYIGDEEIIKVLTHKQKQLREIIGYKNGFASLTSMKRKKSMFDISVYLLWDNKKQVIGVFTIAGDAQLEPCNCDTDLYYDKSLPEVFSQI